jgi:magnesium-transporting ATPase (P-type)
MAASGPLYARATTMCYGGIIFAAAGNAMALRTERESLFKVGFFANRLLLAGVAWVALILLALCYVPFLQRLFGTAPLEGQDLLFLLMGFSISLMLRGFYTEYGWSQRFALTSFGITARHLWIFFDYDERQTHRGNAANVFC